MEHPVITEAINQKILVRYKKTGRGRQYYQFNRNRCSCQTLHYGWKMHDDSCPVNKFHAIFDQSEKIKFLEGLIDLLSG